MSIFLIIISILLWAGALLMLWKQQLVAPVLSYAALFLLSLAKIHGLPLLPLNSTILIGWLAMTLVVTVATMLQPAALRAQTRGVGYLLGGALTGMVVGLLGYTFSGSPSTLYGIMILFTVIGEFFGYFLFTRTPLGRDVAPRTGRFFKYLLAKGFPVAITVMLIGIACVLTILQANS